VAGILSPAENSAPAQIRLGNGDPPDRVVKGRIAYYCLIPVDTGPGTSTGEATELPYSLWNSDVRYLVHKSPRLFS